MINSRSFHVDCGPQFVVSRGVAFSTVVLPAGTDTAGWVDVTAVGDTYSRFVKPDGRTVDCAEHAAALAAVMRRQEGGAA